MSASEKPQRWRIACVQHGDYLKALALVKGGQQEPYFGMYQSVAALQELLARHDSLVVSLDAPPYEVRRGSQTFVGHPFPKAYAKLIGIRWELYARPVLRHFERFNPTHVLLRCSTPLGLHVALWCKQRRIPTIAMFANAIGGTDVSSRVNGKWLMNVLADPIFSRVYNYKPTACRSMVDYGLDPAKAFPWEYDGERQPSALPPKRLERTDQIHIVFAARMIEAKGPLDVVDAVRTLRQRGIAARATMFGDGPSLQDVRARAVGLPADAIATPGWVGNDTLFEAFRAATFACVPTHPSFMEGMPMALTEALASRTPVLASDCEVFARSFRDGEGVRLFKAANPVDLAETAAEVFADPVQYDALSVSTQAAFDRVSAHRSFRDVIEQWGRELAEQSRPAAG